MTSTKKHKVSHDPYITHCSSVLGVFSRPILPQFSFPLFHIVPGAPERFSFILRLQPISPNYFASTRSLPLQLASVETRAIPATPGSKSHSSSISALVHHHTAFLSVVGPRMSFRGPPHLLFYSRLFFSPIVSNPTPLFLLILMIPRSVLSSPPSPKTQAPFTPLLVPPHVFSAQDPLKTAIKHSCYEPRPDVYLLGHPIPVHGFPSWASHT